MDAHQPPGNFERRLADEPGAIAALAADFGAWAARAALADRDVSQVGVVIEELVTNVIVHGFRAGGGAWMELRIAHRGDCLEIELRDDAPAFDPFSAPPPSLTAGIATRKVGGLGVHLVRTLMDEWSYARDGAQNVVSLRRRIAPRP